MIKFVPSTNRLDEQIRQLFKKHVPEVASGLVQVMSTAYEPGYLMVAVHSRARKSDPVRVFVADEGLRVKLVAAELQQTGKVHVVLWSQSPKTFILNALSPVGTRLSEAQIELEHAERKAWIEIDRNTFFHLSDKERTRVRLVSKLVGWNIRLLPIGS